MPTLSPDGTGRLTPLALDRAEARLEGLPLSVGLAGMTGAQVEGLGARIARVFSLCRAFVTGRRA